MSTPLDPKFEIFICLDVFRTQERYGDTLDRSVRRVMNSDVGTSTSKTNSQSSSSQSEKSENGSSKSQSQTGGYFNGNSS